MNDLGEKLRSVIWNVSLSLKSELSEVRGSFWMKYLTARVKMNCDAAAALTFSSLERKWKSVLEILTASSDFPGRTDKACLK